MTYPEQVTKIKQYTIHTVTALNDGLHLTTITLGNLIASVPEYFALTMTGHHPALAATFALASVVTATLSATLGGAMWLVFLSQIAISMGTVWYSGGTIETAWPAVTALVALAVSRYQKEKATTESQRQENSEDRHERLERERIASNERIEKQRIKASQPVSETQDTKPDMKQAQNMRDEGMSLREIAKALGVSPSTISRYTVSGETPVQHLNGTAKGAHN